MSAGTILDVQNLRISVRSDEGEFVAVDDVSFSVRAGEVFGIVGESGCGKSLTVLSIPQLLPRSIVRVTGGRAIFEGIDMFAADPGTRRRILGRRIGTIFQEPGTALNPVFTIGTQIAEVVETHMGVSRAEALGEARRMLERVAVPDAAHRLGQYPHELSGGLRQRVMIALALVCRPTLLIADEPTTALDVTIQAQILRLLRDLQEEFGMSIVLVTHDLGVISEFSDRMMVMYAGKSIESGPTEAILQNPNHPYTQGLMRCALSLDGREGQLQTIQGTVPTLSGMPHACRFADRCARRQQVCGTVSPDSIAIEQDHFVSCYFPGQKRDAA